MNYVSVTVGNKTFFTGEIAIVGIPEDKYERITDYRNEAFILACEKLGVDPNASCVLDWSFLGPNLTFVNTDTNNTWISVEDHLPEYGKRVLVSVQGIDESLIGWYDEEYEWLVEHKLSECKMMPVTHWREKPER